MQVTIDKARRGHRSARVYRASGGVFPRDLGRFADGNDLAAKHRDCRITHDTALGIDSDQPLYILDDKINVLHARLACFSYLFSPT